MYSTSPSTMETSSGLINSTEMKMSSTVPCMIILNKSVPTCTVIIIILISIFCKYCKQIPVGVTWTYADNDIVYCSEHVLILCSYLFHSFAHLIHHGNHCKSHTGRCVEYKTHPPPLGIESHHHYMHLQNDIAILNLYSFKCCNLECM